MNPEISQLAIVLTFATILGIVALRWRQPMIIAYVVTGVLLAQTGWLSGTIQPLWQTFSDFGITFLLFLVGLEINYSSLKRVGAASVIIGLGQVVFTFVAGFLLLLLLGQTPVIAGYIALAMTFSSTVIVVKLLSEKNDMASLHGKIALGILLIQDIVAIFFLVVLGAGASHTQLASHIIISVLQGSALFILIFVVGRRAMPRVFTYLAHSQELLFLASLAWLFLMATLADRLGLSLAAGGFLAGLALANSAEHLQIASRVRPLRDFFLAIFFIFLGTTLAVADLQSVLWPIILLSAFVLIGNPLIVMLIMSSMGYHHRTGFMTGISIAQISEFSFVLAALGARLGQLPPAAVTIITAVGVVTIIISSSLITHSEAVYRWLRPILDRWLGREKLPTEPRQPAPIYPIVLIGAHRVGRSVLGYLKPNDVMTIEYNPDVVAELRKEKRPVLFGDGSDPDILSAINWSGVRLVISTSPGVDDHLTVLHFLHQLPGRQPKFIGRANTATDARRLYAAGADYVMFPSLTAGQYLGQAISGDLQLNHLKKLRQRDQELLSLKA